MKKNLKTNQISNKNFFKKNKSLLKFNNNPNNENVVIIGGKNPCYLALKNPKRIIQKIFINQANYNNLIDFLNNKKLDFKEKISVVDNVFFNKTFPLDFVHQSIAVQTLKIKDGNEFELLSFLNSIENKNLLPNLLILDQISDPHNVGAIIRSAVAFDFKNIILCSHHSAKESSSLIKASAGNIEFANIFVVTNLNNLIEKLKKIGYWCIGLDGNGNNNLNQISDIKNIVLIVGSEGFGIRQLVKKNCDFLIKINTNKIVESLNVSVATAIALNFIYNAKFKLNN